MEFEFDRETDALLRQAAQSETAPDNSKFQIPNSKLPHLDADEIAAFAENALPEKTRLLFTAHFADCARCRKILSNVISLNSETANEIVHATETVKIANIAVVEAPWYRRLFAAPNPAFAMGALVLVFGALIAFTLLQKSPQSPEVSQSSKMPINARVAGGSGETQTTNSNASSSANSAMSNSSTSMMSNGGASMTNSANVSSPTGGELKTAAPNSALSNSNAAAAEKASNEKIKPAKNKSPSEPPSVAQAYKNELQTSDLRLAEQKKEMSDKEEKMRSAENDAAKDKNQVKSVAAAPPLAGASRSAPADSMARAKGAIQPQPETRQSGGKTFRRENSVWFDSSYKGENAKNVRRGSEEFKKLDAGLRSIADSFSGAVVVVWKDRAYRIQ